MRTVCLLALRELLEDDYAVENAFVKMNNKNGDKFILIRFKDGTEEIINCAGYRGTYILYRIGKLFEERGEFR